MDCAGALAAVLSVILFPAPAAYADAIADYRDGYASYRGAAMDAFHELLEGNRAEAKAPLDLAIARWRELDAIGASDPFAVMVSKKKRRAFSKLRGPVLKQLVKARGILDATSQPTSAAVKRARKANKRSSKVARYLDSLRTPGASVVERKASSTGFHPPGKAIEFQMLARDETGARCTGTPVVSVANLFGAAAVDPTSLAATAQAAFAVMMGPDMGIAQVQGTLCGWTDTTFVFNNGTKNKSCGNGEVDAGEECDDGAGNSDADPDACRMNCRLPRCGDGVLDAGEACEPELAGLGCDGGAECVPATLARACTCAAACTVSPAPASVSLQIGAASGVCGCTLGSADAGACGPQGSNMSDLFCGDLLVGGGLSAVPPGRVPDGIHLTMAAAMCDDATLILGPSEGTSAKDCSGGADMTGAPQCFFGPPLPIPNFIPAVSTCVVNGLAADVTGTVDTSTGKQALEMSLACRVFLTGVAYDDEMSVEVETCPRCVDGEGAAAASGTCNLGQHAGQACESTNSTGLTIDCLPDDDLFVGALDIALDPLTTGTTVLAAEDGMFCNFGLCVGGPEDRLPCGSDSDCPAGICQPRCQGGSAEGQSCATDDDCQGTVNGVCGQMTQGAFAGGAPVRRVVQSGTPAAAPLAVGDTKPAKLGGVFCVPRTGTPAIDSVTNLPGPGALSLDVAISLE
jgi:hypothetical protein